VDSMAVIVALWQVMMNFSMMINVTAACIIQRHVIMIKEPVMAFGLGTPIA